MSAKDQIISKLEEVYDAGTVTAGNVYKGWDYDGAVQSHGWWFAFFGGSKVYLGPSVEAAIETIDQIAESRVE
jgi:hypothetical protein